MLYHTNLHIIYNIKFIQYIIYMLDNFLCSSYNKTNKELINFFQV